MPSRFALLTRPVWQGEPIHGLDDPRIVSAPLQILKPLVPPRADLDALVCAVSPWLVFTSPSAVVAFQKWITEHGLGLNKTLNPAADIFAVGEGTRDGICSAACRSLFTASQLNEILVGQDSAHADAHALLAAMQDLIKNGRRRPDQAFVIQGEGANPLLAQGLQAMQIKAIGLSLYQRIDVDWPADIVHRIKKAGHKEAVIVVTSSRGAQLALGQLASQGMTSRDVGWATHHQTIAQALKAHGLEPIGRVRLEPKKLSQDLFEHENTW